MAEQPAATPFDLAVFLVACARDAIEATPAYGALRLLQAVTRLAPLAGDPFVDRLAAAAERLGSLLMEDGDAFAAALDRLLAETAAEARRRNTA